MSRIAIVTGGASGIGRALGAALVRRGDQVVLADGMGQYVEADIVAKQEFAGYWEYVLDEAIFAAPAHPFWGGTALIGPAGDLLGIGSLQLQQGGAGAARPINMVVPIDLLTPILEDLATRGRPNRPARPWLGLYAAEDEGGRRESDAVELHATAEHQLRGAVAALGGLAVVVEVGNERPGRRVDAKEPVGVDVRGRVEIRFARAEIYHILPFRLHGFRRLHGG